MPTWVAVAAALVAVALLIALVVVRARHRARATRLRGELATRHPIVMLHGIAGFDAIGVPGFKQDYFRGIVDYLESRGAVIFRPKLPSMAPVPERAERLAAFLRDLPVDRVNIIAHSMGGLDARYAIAHLGAADKVACLVTIGTPHRGSPLAKLKDNLLAAAVRKLAAGVGIDTSGFDGLTVEAMTRFNETVPDDDSVLYASVITSSDTSSGINPLLIPIQKILAAKWGPNDGVVPKSSQSWGEIWLDLECDHYDQIGWSTAGFDAPGMYATLVRTLQERQL